jgi:creatinine amidohydrolase
MAGASAVPGTISAMRFVDFTYEELRELSPRVAAVFVPLGCTEQQGPHLTVGFDTLMVDRLCSQMAERLEEQGVQVLVMPVLPFGPTPEHAGFGHGYVNLRRETHEAVAQDVLESLAQQGFRRLIVWRGCGQHNLSRPIDAFNASQSDARAVQPVIDYGRIAMEVLGDVPGGHADSFATSICLFLEEARVRQERVAMPTLRAFEWSEDMDFTAISDTGVIGDPMHASRDAGRVMWEKCLDAGVEVVMDILNDRTVSQRWQFLPPPA